MVELGEVCDVQMGVAPKGETYVGLNEGVPLVAGAADYGKAFPNPKKATSQPTKLSVKGDLILCVRATIGNVIWADKSYCLGRGVAGLRVKETLDSHYLFYVLKESERELYEHATGSTFLQINKKTIESLKIPLPPLPIQKQIAAILEKADTLRQQCQQMQTELNALAQSVFLEMFGDPIAGNKKFKEVKLEQVATVQIGPFGSMLHRSDYIEGGIPLVNPTHIVKGKIMPDMSLTLRQDKYESLSQYHLMIDDIVMGRRGEMGRCAVIDKDSEGYFCGTGSLLIRPNKKLIRPKYLNDLLSSLSIKRWFIQQSQGATMPNLNKSIVNNIPLILPSIERQDEYEEIQNYISYQLEKVSQAVKQQNNLFNALMQKAFNGELIPDAQ